jgi:dimethylargininase
MLKFATALRTCHLQLDKSQRICRFFSTCGQQSRDNGPSSGRQQQKFGSAIVRELPSSFVNALHQHYSDPVTAIPVDIDIARYQHRAYISALQRIIPNVVILPALEQYPDCCFVEDTVVAIGETALITRPGHSDRVGEVDSVKEALLRLASSSRVDAESSVREAMMIVKDMREMSESATCDGGDILYTGRHLFVGLSNRTNMASVPILKSVFRDMSDSIVVVPPVIQGEKVLHLKSAVTHLDERTLLVPTGQLGQQLLQAMNAHALGYKAYHLPDTLACNAVACNGHILAQDTPCRESKETLLKAAENCYMQLVYVKTSELAKKDAALTCCSVLLSI